jgi:hypothetical protein
MHPDEAVQLALQDLRSRAPNSAPPHVEARHRGLDLLRAYLSPLRWYVTDGRSPAGDVTEVGHLPRPCVHAGPAPAMDEALLPLAMGACP